ncbi:MULTISPECIES: DUF3107 domain-containing protein [Corynebacterium]|uniref:ATP-binding protein n=1 Tax=Corynebacterium lipophiloflavum (strain ATCC 700352 / DSM 44291 / CCUG 37336 / JCM 10383 / DMMZ 1944) TaxID=525263 RepID=C0XV83_CORLD|nr:MULTISPECIES: DUF3107 domain-containing protein [Corynebacterium]EEI15849.1 hypothetical protein HMPREF0298_2353 [Corynebacterium lipophiloflavum DSM 44291]MCT2154804.1 DUF3107 domain-containing protein [Corynebacterium sanguinis]
MDIRIGLSDSQRELAVSSNEMQEDVLARVSAAIAEGQPTLTLEDDKGRKFLVRTERIAYVEVGNSNARAVGFAR